MLIFSQAAVLLLLALVAVAFLAMLRHGNKSQDTQLRESGSGAFSRLWRGEVGKGGKACSNPHKGETMLLPMLLVDQLNPKTMESVKKFPVCEIPEEGVPISRPNANIDDGILLSKATREAYTVSAHHAVIAMDEDGIFIQDCGSHNKMFEKGRGKAVDELNITDGLIVYLGMQPLRFSIPTLYDADDMREGAEEDMNPGMTQLYREKSPGASGPVIRRRKR